MRLVNTVRVLDATQTPILRFYVKSGISSAGHATCVMEDRNECRVVMGKPKGKGTPEIPTYR